jgi:hypothetical protein
MTAAVLDNATAVQTRKRVVDHLTLHSSHKGCYEAGLHDKTPQGREWCRTGSGYNGIQEKLTVPQNMKSDNSTVVHAPGEDGKILLCSASGWMNMKPVDSPVTCKQCQKLSA